jgi:hypothetical protein
MTRNNFAWPTRGSHERGECSSVLTKGRFADPQSETGTRSSFAAWLCLLLARERCARTARSLNAGFFVRRKAGVDQLAERKLLRIVAGGDMIAAGDSINAIAESIRYLRPASYEVEEVIEGHGGANRRICRFWGWITHQDDGVISVEPCLSVLEG